MKAATKKRNTKGQAAGMSNAASALEMATEIRQHHSRLFSLAAALTNQLTPDEGEDAMDYNALSFAELLEELLADTAQECRLLDVLQVMAATEPERAVRHG